MKTPKLILPLFVTTGILLSACSPADNLFGFEQTPEVGDTIHFSSSATPEGWTAQNDGGSGSGAKVDAERPMPFVKDNCYFSRTVEYVPKGYETRGDDYNTKNFVYEFGQAFKNNELKTETVSVKTEKGTMDMLSTSVSYDDPDSGKSSTRIAARVISKVKTSGYKAENAPENPYLQNPAEGLPVVFIKVDCVQGDTVDDTEWKKLIDSTTVSLNSPVASPATPSADTGPFTPVPVAPTATGTAAPASPEPSTAETSEGNK